MNEEKNPVGIPVSERVWVQIRKEDGRVYYITSKVSDRSVYFLYEFKNGKAIKLDKDPSPKKLEERNITSASTKGK